MSLKKAIASYRKKKSVAPSDILEYAAQEAARAVVEEKLVSKIEDLINQTERELTRARESFLQKINTLLSKSEIDIAQRVRARAIEIKGDDGYTPVKGKDYFDGKTPSDSKITELIKPLIPPPIPGKNGSPDTPDEVTNKVNRGKPLIKQERIEGLAETFETFKQAINRVSQNKGGGGGMGNFYPEQIGIGDGLTTSFPLTHKVASGGTAIMVLVQGQPQEYTTHYTVNNTNKTADFTTAPPNGAIIHAWYVRT